MPSHTPVSYTHLVDEQRDDRATAAHDVAVTGAADGGAATLSSHTGIGVDDVLHQDVYKRQLLQQSAA